MKRKLILLGIAALCGLFFASPLYAQPLLALFQPPMDATCPLTNVEKDASVKAFNTLAPIFRDPRCINCHGAVDPFAPEPETRHLGGKIDVKFKTVPTDKGPVVVMDEAATFEQCQECHGLLPGWRVAPQDISFVGKDNQTLCEQMKDKFGAADVFLVHMDRDVGPIKFVTEAFKGTRALNETGQQFYEDGAHMPYTLLPPHISHAVVNQEAEAWVDAMGGEFVGDKSCGCEPPQESNGTGTLEYDVTATYHVQTQAKIAYGAMTGTVTNHEHVTSQLQVHLGLPQYDKVPGIVTATNQIELDGSGNASGTYGQASANIIGQLSGSGTTHNPSLPGDDNYNRPTGMTKFGVQGVNGPQPATPGHLQLSTVNGASTYVLSLGISQIIPQYTWHLHVDAGSPQGCTQDKSYDNVPQLLTVVFKGDPSCAGNSSRKQSQPLLFGVVSPNRAHPNILAEGTYDPHTGLLGGNSTFSSEDCGVVSQIDPLSDLAITLDSTLGAMIPHTPTMYGRVAAGGTDPGAACHIQFTFTWHIQIQPQ